MAFLRYQDRLGVHYYELGAKDVVTIGRGKNCDITLNDTQASRLHCEIRKHPAVWVVSDLKSKNGTMVNGTPISAWTLKEDDMVTVGITSIQYRLRKA